MKSIVLVIFSFIVCVIDITAQKYPINNYEFSFNHRSYFSEHRELDLATNPGRISIIKDFHGYNKTDVAYGIKPVYMVFSIADWAITGGDDDEKMFRFGDLITLTPGYFCAAKSYYYDSIGTQTEVKKTVLLGTGFGFGAFVMIHPTADYGFGVKWLWEGFGEMIESRSNHSFNYYQPNTFFTIFGNYKIFSLELSSSLFKKEKDEAFMIQHENERSTKRNRSLLGEFFQSKLYGLKFKVFFNENKKAYAFGKYELIKGTWHEGVTDTNLQPIEGAMYPFSDFELFRRDKFKTYDIGFGLTF